MGHWGGSRVEGPPWPTVAKTESLPHGLAEIMIQTKLNCNAHYVLNDTKNT